MRRLRAELSAQASGNNHATVRWQARHGGAAQRCMDIPPCVVLTKFEHFLVKKGQRKPATQLIFSAVEIYPVLLGLVPTFFKSAD